MLILLSWLLGLLTAAGVTFTLGAAWAVARLGGATAPHGPAEPVTLLKPLHGAEPRLADNLATFLDQDWAAPIQLVAGVQRDEDPALAALDTLPLPAGGEIVAVIDSTTHGPNAKVANLVNMAAAARHDLLVASDSDMAAPRDYLAMLAGALAAPGVGAATCLYHGRGDAGGWSRLAAAGISYHFLPQLAVGLALGLARPGMGSTIALRRGTLAAIGGFASFTHALADDYALCEAVRALDLKVVVPPMLLVHGCVERSLREVWRHERRWAATILGINPGGQLGTIVTHPLPLALLCLPLAPVAGTVLLALALASRLMLKRAVDRWARAGSASAWLLPLRDCLSFAVFLSAFLTRHVEWRGQRLRMAGGGRIASEPESLTI